MKTKKKFSILLASAVFALASIGNAFAYNGQDCGCPPLGSRTTVNFSTLADGSGNLTATNTVLDCAHTYVLDNTGAYAGGKYYVGIGKSITIAPGTIIKGMPETTPGSSRNGGVLVISRGAKIIAAGSESCPIIWTTTLDVNVDGSYGIKNKGKWGGLIICGTASNNLVAQPADPPRNNYSPVGNGRICTATSGVGFIEGFTNVESRIFFGAGDAAFPSFNDDDNSGIVTYNSFRHGGEVIGANNEINGLTLGSVGRGTTLHHIEVVSNLDDGIEFFGGTVDLKYASVLFNDDDGFDWDINWSGRGQFWVVVKTDPTTASGGDNGFESDGDDNVVGIGPFSNPQVYNATFIGSLGQNGTALTPRNAVGWGTGIMCKEATKGIIRNSIIANYGRGVDIKNNSRAGATITDDAYDHWNAGTFKLECNTFVNVDSLLWINGVHTTAGADFTKFTSTDNNIALSSVAGFDYLYAMDTTAAGTNLVASGIDLIPAANLTSTCTVAPVDGFFTPAAYRGAFEAGKKSWLSNYTLNAIIDLEDALVPCPTDGNADGQTNVTDFNALLGAFGTSCD